MKNILIVYPHNFYEKNSGINSRYFEFVKYFEKRNFNVDFFSIENFESKWENIDDIKEKPINKIYLYDFRQNNGKLKIHVYLKNFLNDFFKLLKKRTSKIKYKSLPDYTFPSMKKKFQNIVTSNHYDYIIISYLYWAFLIKDIFFGGKIILEISDFLTLNLFDSTHGKINIGNLINDEISRAALFNQIICISYDEMTFFSQFIPKSKFYYIPFFLNDNSYKKKSKKKYDLVLIASENPHNIIGINWFFKNVYPLLDKNISIFIGGKITKYVNEEKNITKELFVDVIDKIYLSSKIAICPLLGGSGIKVKVIEALSYGIPVVATSKGIIGFKDKQNNGCVIADNPKAFAQSINSLLGNNKNYNNITKKAIEYFNSNFSVDIIYNDLDKIFI